jgi:hypothetical protein
MGRSNLVIEAEPWSPFSTVAMQAIEYIRFGPFDAAYYQQLVDDTFKVRLGAYLQHELVPQLTIAPDRVEGTLIALNDEDRYCGPNSCIKDSFCLKLQFLQGVLQESVDVCLHYSPCKGTFYTSNHEPIRLWTLARQRRLLEIEELWAKDKTAIRTIWEGMDSGEIADGSPKICPVCNSKLEISIRPDSMMLRCLECFTMQSHRDPETREFQHGHTRFHPKYFKSI